VITRTSVTRGGGASVGPHSSAWVTAGAVCWIATVGYLLVQPVVAAGWEPTAYDVTADTISELGVTTCAPYPQLDGTLVTTCSPLHGLMNAAFVVAGLLTVAGAVLTRPSWPNTAITTTGLVFVGLAGGGGALVGLAPLDASPLVHAVGAGLQVPGAIAPALIGAALWRRHRPLSVFSWTWGLVGSVASPLYLGGIPLGLGIGVMERLAFESLIVWMLGAGAVLLCRPRAQLG
jgi:hypothetical protein